MTKRRCSRSARFGASVALGARFGKKCRSVKVWSSEGTSGRVLEKASLGQGFELPLHSARVLEKNVRRARFGALKALGAGFGKKRPAGKVWSSKAMSGCGGTASVGALVAFRGLPSACTCETDRLARVGLGGL